MSACHDDCETYVVRDVLDRITHNPADHLRQWSAYMYNPTGPNVQTDPPAGGERASMEDFDAAWSRGVKRSDFDPTHVDIAYTVWGDYCGSTAERSNHRSLLRDWPDVFVDTYGGFGSSGLALPLDATIGECVLDALAGLLDYPLYDEEDHSELESDLESEDWKSWGRRDWVGDVEDALLRRPDADETVEYLESLNDSTIDDIASDAAMLDSTGRPRYDAETAVSGVWDREEWADWVRAGAERIVAGYLYDLAHDQDVHDPSDTHDPLF